MDNKNFLSITDNLAIDNDDSNYINSKGASLYGPDTFAESVEYYRLASAMGNDQATSNLGYCYLYGRSIEPNLSLAIAYFKIAAKCGNIDAAYKLGDIYGSDKWGVLDKELSVYYYRMAVSFLINVEWSDGPVIAKCDEFQKYPSLCFALGREMSKGGHMNTNLDIAYQFLKQAEIGYRKELMNGSEFFKKPYESVVELLKSDQFDDIAKYYDELFESMA